jgi:hypothetical protein
MVTVGICIEDAKAESMINTYYSLRGHARGHYTFICSSHIRICPNQQKHIDVIQSHLCIEDDPLVTDNVMTLSFMCRCDLLVQTGTFVQILYMVIRIRVSFGMSKT